MNTNRKSFERTGQQRTVLSLVRGLFQDRSGQVLPVAALLFTIGLGLAGLGIDVGRAYVIRSQLQNSANAAALAAAGYVYTSKTSSVNTTTQADLYGSEGTEDPDPYATATPTVQRVCLNMLMPSGSSCSSSSTPNAVRVTETASVKTFFMSIFGVKTLSMGATATASMTGGAGTNQYNVAIIEDATGSMSTADTNCGGITEFQCALNGIQTLLAASNPCPVGLSTCTDSQANMHVALFTFPNMDVSALPVANACSTTSYSEPAPYRVMTLPKPTNTSYAPLTYSENGSTWTASYEVTYNASDADANGFVSDYYSPSSTATGGLNASSSLVNAVGYGGTGSGSKTGCLPISYSGIAPNGASNYASGSSVSYTSPSSSSATVNTTDVGEGITYYASAIYAAQSALTAEQALHPGSQNALILLSDGQANTQWIYFPQGTVSFSGTYASGKTNKATASTYSSGSPGYSTLNSTPNTTALNAYNLSTPNQEVSGTISGLYPDFIDECQQAITAGQYATGKGTTVYSVAYGSEQTGCGSGSHPDDYTDVTTVATGNNASFTASTLTPCIAMENIASSLSTFYSDYLQSGSGVDTSCVDNSHPVTALTDIFKAIASNFNKPRLLPSNAPYVVVTD